MQKTLLGCCYKMNFVRYRIKSNATSASIHTNLICHSKIFFRKYFYSKKITYIILFQLYDVENLEPNILFPLNISVFQKGHFFLVGGSTYFAQTFCDGKPDGQDELFPIFFYLTFWRLIWRPLKSCKTPKSISNFERVPIKPPHFSG